MGSVLEYPLKQLHTMTTPKTPAIPVIRSATSQAIKRLFKGLNPRLAEAAEKALQALNTETVTRGDLAAILVNHSDKFDDIFRESQIIVRAFDLLFVQIINGRADKARFEVAELPAKVPKPKVKRVKIAKDETPKPAESISLNREKKEKPEGSLRQHINENCRHGIFPDEELNTLATLAQLGDEEATTLLVKACQRFILKLASKYRHPRLQTMDFIQEGNVALMESIRAGGYDQSRGKFFSYLFHIVRGAMSRMFYATYRTIKRAYSIEFTSRRISRTIIQLGQELSREPDEGEILNRMHSVKNAERVLRLYMEGQDVSMDALNEYGYSLSETLATATFKTPAQYALNGEELTDLKLRIMRLVAVVKEIKVMKGKESQKAIFLARYGIGSEEKFGEMQKIEDIARFYGGISEQAVSQTVQRMWKRIRKKTGKLGSHLDLISSHQELTATLVAIIVLENNLE